jgi:hypothetical protein
MTPQTRFAGIRPETEAARRITFCQNRHLLDWCMPRTNLVLISERNAREHNRTVLKVETTGAKPGGRARSSAAAYQPILVRIAAQIDCDGVLHLPD